MNIGFVGVGRMGANMARRLKDRGFHVTAVYDVNRAAATSLATELGCAACQTLGDATAGADVIFTIVTDDKAMREIYTGGDNLLANAHGKLFINCATVSPKVHLEVERLADAHIQREPVHCDPMADAHPNRSNLAIVDPDAG